MLAEENPIRSMLGASTNIEVAGHSLAIANGGGVTRWLDPSLELASK